MFAQHPEIAKRWTEKYGSGTQNATLKAAADRYHIERPRTPAKPVQNNSVSPAPSVVSRQSPGSVPPKKRGR